jgi:hypothetical protein
MLEHALHAPEAAAGENGLLEAGRSDWGGWGGAGQQAEERRRNGWDESHGDNVVRGRRERNRSGKPPRSCFCNLLSRQVPDDDAFSALERFNHDQ